MTDAPSEMTRMHTQMMKCALQIDETRAYWAHADAGSVPNSTEAFERYWFGAKSLPRVKVLLANLKTRFAAFPEAQWVLHRWPEMTPTVRQLIVHWHVQLADPLYRTFTAEFLGERRGRLEPTVTRAAVTRWVAGQGPSRWTHPSHVQFASKLLSSAYAAGLVTATRDPRPLAVPRVELVALEYLLYLLRGVRFEGTLTDNPYLRSVGIGPNALPTELRRSEAIDVRTLGGVVELNWRHPSLRAWAEAALPLKKPTP